MSWTWWMTVLVILAVLVLIGCIPSASTRPTARAACFSRRRSAFSGCRFSLQSRKKAQKAEKSKEVQTAEASRIACTVRSAGCSNGRSSPAKKLALPGGLRGILRLVNLALSTLGDLRRKLRVES